MAIETLGAALRQINRLFAEGVIGGLSDAQLLERFLTQGDAGAFEALVGRHGPIVLSVCRGILRDPSDAEDAFQATFLILVQKGGTIRGRDALGGWLYQVAHRVAIQANSAAARRRAHERQVGLMEVATSTSGPAVSDDLLPALHEEIARLPEKYRVAIVLCDLEGMTQAQAAGQLHWSERTLRNRLAKGRARLKRRLARRGLAPDGAMLGAVFLREARAAVPPAWCESTVRAALATVNHSAAAGAVSTAAYKLTREVLQIMLVQKLKLASAALITVGMTAWAASAAPGIDKGDQQDAVAVPQAPKMTRPLVLPGSTALDPTRLARIRARFTPARVVQLAQVWDRSAKTGNIEFRELRPGDSVSKGDVLGILFSADVVSKKNDLLDAFVQLELDQKILDEAQKHAQAIPQVFLLSAARSVQGDRNAINRALNNLKAWDIPQEEIDALHAEAKQISAKNGWFKTPEGRWINRDKKAAAAKADPGKNEDNEDPRGRVTLRSPIDGVVIECNVRIGEMVMDNTVNLFQIANISSLVVIANCPEDSLPSLEALGSKERRWSVRTVGAEAGTGLPGTIDEISHVIDPKQHTAVIKGHIDNPEKRIRAGQFVTATVNIPLK